jgi:hypothetical protein
LAQKRLDNSLATDVEAGRPLIQLPQHAGREIDIYSLYRLHHRELIREELRNILAS